MRLTAHAGFGGRPPGKGPGSPGVNAGPRWAAHPTSVSIISKWAGHYDSAFTQKTYVHASGEDLDQGRKALARIHKIA